MCLLLVFKFGIEFVEIELMFVLIFMLVLKEMGVLYLKTLLDRSLM